MFEPGLPWWVLSPPEIHAAGYGFIEGLKFWKRRVTPYEEVDKLPLSPEWKNDIKEKYHYYRTCFEIPETVVMLAVAAHLVNSNQDLVWSLAGKFFGVM